MIIVSIHIILLFELSNTTQLIVWLERNKNREKITSNHSSNQETELSYCTHTFIDFSTGFFPPPSPIIRKKISNDTSTYRPHTNLHWLKTIPEQQITVFIFVLFCLLENSVHFSSLHEKFNHHFLCILYVVTWCVKVFVTQNEIELEKKNTRTHTTQLLPH